MQLSRNCRLDLCRLLPTPKVHLVGTVDTKNLANEYSQRILNSGDIQGTRVASFLEPPQNRDSQMEWVARSLAIQIN